MSEIYEDSEMSNGDNLDSYNHEYDSHNYKNDYDVNEYDYDYEIDSQILTEKKLNKNYNQDESYEILRSGDIEKLRSRIIEDFAEFTSLSRDEAAIVLIHYQWNVERLKEIWYDKIEENRVKCGLDMNDEAKKIKENSNQNYNQNRKLSSDT